MSRPGSFDPIGAGEPTVPEYRVYKITRDGHVAGPPENLDLPDDGAALKEATKLVNGQDVEIWQSGQ